ncbi:MAG TPA: hypothetical protein VJZ00_15320 [Thermoanaerobaculia bacterium]|nr:hypothetical protein [Thermoanaerobaculia bacterium]
MEISIAPLAPIEDGPEIVAAGYVWPSAFVHGSRLIVNVPLGVSGGRLQVRSPVASRPPFALAAPFFTDRSSCGCGKSDTGLAWADVLKLQTPAVTRMFSRPGETQPEMVNVRSPLFPKPELL